MSDAGQAFEYSTAYRRIELISGAPRYLLGLAMLGGSVFLLARVPGAPPLFIVMAVLFTLLAITTWVAIALVVVRLYRNRLEVSPAGVAFHAWNNFTLRAAWGEIRWAPGRDDVILLETASLEESPLARRFRRQELEPPYPLVLARFEEGASRAVATHLPPETPETDEETP